MDDSFEVVVEKNSLPSFRLEGVGECHAPELDLELRAAKMEVSSTRSVSVLLARIQWLLTSHCCLVGQVLMVSACNVSRAS